MVLNGQQWFDSTHTMNCINLNDYGWDDRVSSLAVYRTELGAYAQGRWESFTTTEGIDFTYHLGMSSTDSHSTEESMSYSMSESMSAGIEFLGIGASTDISAAFETGIVVDTQEEFSASVDVTYNISCSEGQVGDGVGLWQFVVESSDKSVITRTDHTVCRYGELYNKSPNSPWNACANGDCSECVNGWEE